MTAFPLPPVAEVSEVAAPVTFQVITGNRYLHALETPDDGSGQVRGFRERTMVSIDEATGLVSIESEYGTFSYYWPPAYRSCDLFTFLTSLDFGYFMGKAAKQPYREIDAKATLKHYRAELLRERSQRDMDKDEARERWDALDSVLSGIDLRNESEFFNAWYQHSALSSWIYPGDVSPSSRDTYGARHFWDVIWQTLISSEAFRAHIKPKAAAA